MPFTKNFIFFLILFFLCANGQTLLAKGNKQYKNMFSKEKERNANRKAFTKEKNLEQLLRLIKEAGLGKEELSKWNLNFPKDQIALMKYLNKLQAKKIEEKKREQAFLGKNFRTDLDVWHDLQDNESDRLLKISDRMIDEGY